jgi:kynureninase
VVDHRPGAGIRISPHFYSSDAELTSCIEQIRQILNGGAWRKHDPAGGTGF